jgi:hypothetical protein
LYNNCIAARKAAEGDVSVQQNAAPQGAMGAWSNGAAGMEVD